VDNIKIDLVKMVRDVVNWLGLAQDRDDRIVLINAVMNLRVP
jgi:hypothetical protein